MRIAAAMQALRAHATEYGLEALELAIFMVSACVFAILLFHASSPVVDAVGSPTLRRLLMGLAMGATAIALIYSPMGQRSGAHMNPAVTLTYWRLGKVAGWDAIFYIAAQFAGGIAGVALVAFAARSVLADEAVKYVVTVPGRPGPGGSFAAWAAEFAISGVLMGTVLTVSNRRSLTRYTGLFAGALVATWILLAAPISGMSMNPARSFGSALPAGLWTGLWIYFTAPPLAMLAASEVYLRLAGRKRVFCAKLDHCNSRRCIFRCDFQRLMEEPDAQVDAPPRGATALPRSGTAVLCGTAGPPAAGKPWHPPLRNSMPRTDERYAE